MYSINQSCKSEQWVSLSSVICSNGGQKLMTWIFAVAEWGVRWWEACNGVFSCMWWMRCGLWLVYSFVLEEQTAASHSALWSLSFSLISMTATDKTKLNETTSLVRPSDNSKQVSFIFSILVFWLKANLIMNNCWFRIVCIKHLYYLCING